MLASFVRKIGVPERIVAQEEFKNNLGDHVARYAWVLDKVKGKATLDCGCGGGYGTDWLRKKGVNIIGIDCSQKAVKLTPMRESEGTSFVQGDVTFMPFRSNSFEAIISFEVLEHLEDGTPYLSQIYRLLKPNGVFIGSTPLRKPRRYRNGRPQNPFHKKEYQIEEIKNLLEKHFEKVRLKSQRFPPRIVVLLLAQLYNLKVLRNQAVFYPIFDTLKPKDEKCLFIAQKNPRTYPRNFNNKSSSLVQGLQVGTSI